MIGEAGVIRLANGAIEVAVEPDQGAEILFVGRPGGRNVLATYDWSAPLRASRSSTYGDPLADWLSEYRGGWQELFPNAGDACVVNGVALPFHGEVSRARWDVVSQTAQALVLRTPARLPLVLERRMRLAPGAATLLIDETVRCDAGVPVDFLWGHHPAFDAVAGATIDLPAGVVVTASDVYRLPRIDLEPGSRGVWPNVPGLGGGPPVALDRVPVGPVERLAFLSGFGSRTWAAIRGFEPGLGMAMAWDAATFPGAWLWWELGGPGHPWYGRARIVAIEPHAADRADGLAAAIERGKAHRVRPAEARSAWLTMSLFDADERPVLGVDRAGTVTR